MICAALVDRDQVLVLGAEAHVELGGQEQPVQAPDLLRVQGVAHAERVAVVVLEGDHDLALVPAAEIARTKPAASSGRRYGNDRRARK